MLLAFATADAPRTPAGNERELSTRPWPAFGAGLAAVGAYATIGGAVAAGLVGPSSGLVLAVVIDVIVAATV
jgi:hypothetical protein